jgi:hypothetical protein
MNSDIQQKRTDAWKRYMRHMTKNQEMEEMRRKVRNYFIEKEKLYNEYKDLEYQCAVIDGRLHVIPEHKQRVYVRRMFQDRFTEEFLKMNPEEQAKFIDKILRKRKDV